MELEFIQIPLIFDFFLVIISVGGALMTTIISSPSFPAIEPNSRRDAPLKSVFIEIFDFDKSATSALD